MVRFESVNYRSKVWLNGRPIGTNRGAYLPFEIRLPAGLLKRGGVNHLVIRVDSRRKQTDFPPSGLSIVGKPTGGWWNYGGLLREVYLRKINDVDFNTVVVRPDLPCATCAATVTLPRDAAQLRPTRRGASRVTRAVRQPQASPSARAAIGAKRFATLTKQIKVDKPRLWSPASPNLYDASMPSARAATCCSATRCSTGIRSIKVVGGHLFLNGAPHELPRRRRCTRTRARRASRSTTRTATSSSRGSRSSAPR